MKANEIWVRYILFFCGLIWHLSGCAATAPPEYELRYHVEFFPEQDSAQIVIEIPENTFVSEINFRLNPGLHSSATANGKLELKGNRAIWSPPKKHARFSLDVKVSHQRGQGSYDALMTSDWVIVRGDDLVPAAKVKVKKGARARATLVLSGPEVWTGSVTGWPKLSDSNYLIDNPERGFDRPTGWILAGKLGTRRTQLGPTEIVIGAPKGAGLRRMDLLAFLTFVWPEITGAFHLVPAKILVVGAGEPMWRGGLSAPNSLFYHAERPLVSENGTSSLLHEITHVVTGIRGRERDDWIAEGLAEFYSFELLFRAGGITSARRAKVLDKLSEWSRDVKSLRQKSSTGKITARAAVLFDQLDQEIRHKTDNKKNLDDLARGLMKIGKVTTSDLKVICTQLTGSNLKALASPLLD